MTKSYFSFKAVKIQSSSDRWLNNNTKIWMCMKWIGNFLKYLKNLLKWIQVEVINSKAVSFAVNDINKICLFVDKINTELKF